MKNRNNYQFPFSRYPALRLALLFVTGILIADAFEPGLRRIIPVLSAIFLFLVFTEWKNYRKNSVHFSRVAVVLYLLFITGVGTLTMTLQQERKEHPAASLLEISDWEEVEVRGQIESISYTSAGKERWLLDVEYLKLGDNQINHSFKLRILPDEPVSESTLGDKVLLNGTILPVNEPRNPGEFDYKAYLKSQNILAQVRVNEILDFKENTSLTEWIWWREKAVSLTESIFDEKTAPIAKALLLGYKQDLDYDEKTAFARAGLSHIMAVSGLHVGFIVAPFWLIIPMLWIRKNGKVLGLICLILLLFIYAGITGFSSSVMRASVMAVFLTYGRLFHKINDSINVTAASAVLLLLINPVQLFEIGFQLSYSAVFIILLVLPVVQNKLPYELQVRWYGIPIMAVIVSVVVQLGLYPLQVHYFGEISLISPVANALFVPFLGLVIPLSLLALLISAVWPAAGLLLNLPSLWFLNALHSFIEFSSGLEWAWTRASLSSSLYFLLWFFIILAIAAYRISYWRWKWMLSALSVLIVIVSLNLYKDLKPAKLEVLFFDVGQGDAAFVKTPAGKHILIDAGVWSPGYNSGRYIILPYLKNNGIQKLDAIILSHPHTDHIGGILEILEEIQVDVIYNSGYPYETNLYRDYINLADRLDVPVVPVRAGDTLAIDPAMLFLVFGPDGHIYNSDPNEHSVVLNMIYGDSEFLFTGDAGEQQERRLLNTYGHLLDADILKVGHHGSRTSSGSAFLMTVSPEEAVISLADKNKFKHPHAEALHRLTLTKADLLFTAKEKAVLFVSDGDKIWREHWQ